VLLTERQKDAFKELINIAFTLTASSLSELVDTPVLLEVPDVSVHPMSGLSKEFSNLVQGQFVSVQQGFKGKVTGDALLLLDYNSAVTLTNLLMENRGIKMSRLDTSSCEVLLEVGNILLNACMGMFGNLLQIRISFAVPRFHLQKLYSILNSLILGTKGMRYALVVRTAFRFSDGSLIGYIVIVLGVTSLQGLIRSIDTWVQMTTPTVKAKA